MAKLLERLLLNRITDLQIPSSLNPLQGGFRQDFWYVAAHTAFIFQEAVQSLRDLGHKAFVAFLAGLMVKLHAKCVTGHFWSIIDKWYASFYSSIIWNGQSSSSVPVKQCVRQGWGAFSFSLLCLC